MYKYLHALLLSKFHVYYINVCLPMHTYIHACIHAYMHACMIVSD